MRTPRPLGGCHQCCTSPSANCRPAARQDVLARQLRGRVHQGADVLELIAKAVGAAGLVKRRPRQVTATKRLVQQPAVQQQVHGLVRRAHLHGGQDLVPPAAHILERSRARPGWRYSVTSRRASARSAAWPSRKTTSVSLPGGSSTRTCNAAHGSVPGSGTWKTEDRDRESRIESGRSCRSSIFDLRSSILRAGQGTPCGWR